MVLLGLVVVFVALAMVQWPFYNKLEDDRARIQARPSNEKHLPQQAVIAVRMEGSNSEVTISNAEVTVTHSGGFSSGRCSCCGRDRGGFAMVSRAGSTYNGKAIEVDTAICIECWERGAQP